MNNLPFLSVILPTYNREHCIEKMIDSVLMQDFKDFELIVVDDGSTDHTIGMLEQKYNDERLRFFRKENGGVSSARNVGISMAVGEWITFVDSDDYLLDGFFEDIYRTLEEVDCEVLVYGGYSVDGEGKPKDVPLFWSDRTYGEKERIIRSGKEFLKEFCLLGGNSWGCAKVFKSSMLRKNNIHFNEKIHYGEDMLFDIQAYFFSFSVTTSPKKFYVYNVRSMESFWDKSDARMKFNNLVLTYECLKRGEYQELKSYLALNCARHLRTWFPRNLLELQRVKGKLEEIYCQIDERILSDKKERYEVVLIKKRALLTALYVLPILRLIYLKVYSLYSKLSFIHPLISPILQMIKKEKNI